jgi:hypothetical protein
MFNSKPIWRIFSKYWWEYWKNKFYLSNNKYGNRTYRSK